MRKKKRQELNYLEMTPFRVHSHEMRTDGLVNVLVPKFTDKIFSRLLMPRIKKPYIRANLDEFGSATWLIMDGIANVNVISEKLTEKYGEKIEPVKPRLTEFLTQLYKAGFISFIELKKE